MTLCDTLLVQRDLEAASPLEARIHRLLGEIDVRVPITTSKAANNSEEWHHRPRSPGLKWHKEYDTPESLKLGRVLLIDYVRQGNAEPQLSLGLRSSD